MAENANAVATMEAQERRQMSPVDQVRQALSGQKMTAELQMALPPHITVDKFRQVAITAINKSPDLAMADRASLFNACVECAQDGLLPNGREAALVIYNTKDPAGGWTKKVQYMPMIAGIYKKVRESGEINRLAAHVVFEGDDFEYSLGINPTLTHRPNLESTNDKVIGAYAVAHFADGEHDIEFMSMKQINKVKSASKSPDKGPWANWFEEMAKKTVVRRLSKRLPMSPSLDAIIRRQDDMIDLEALNAPDKPQVTASALIEQARGDEDGITVQQDAADMTDEERELFPEDDAGSGDLPALPSGFDIVSWQADITKQIEARKGDPAKVRELRQINGPLMGTIACHFPDEVAAVESAFDEHAPREDQPSMV